MVEADLKTLYDNKPVRFVPKPRSVKCGESWTIHAAQCRLRCTAQLKHHGAAWSDNWLIHYVPLYMSTFGHELNTVRSKGRCFPTDSRVRACPSWLHSISQLERSQVRCWAVHGLLIWQSLTNTWLPCIDRIWEMIWTIFAYAASKHWPPIQ